MARGRAPRHGAAHRPLFSLGRQRCSARGAVILRDLAGSGGAVLLLRRQVSWRALGSTGCASPTRRRAFVDGLLDLALERRAGIAAASPTSTRGGRCSPASRLGRHHCDRDGPTPAYPPRADGPSSIAPAGAVGRAAPCDALRGPAVAIVGSLCRLPVWARRSRTLARDLAAAGLRSSAASRAAVDSAAHRGALDARGPTIDRGGLGSGVDVMYPAEHAALATRDRTAGAVVSEFVARHPAAARVLSAPESDHQRPVARGRGDRGRREERIAHHGAAARSTKAVTCWPCPATC